MNEIDLSINANSFGRFEGFLQIFADSLDRDSTLDRDSCLESVLDSADKIGLSDASIDALRKIGENLLSLMEGR